MIAEQDLFINSGFGVYTPPKSQLLKWIGNKQKFSVEITQNFPRRFNKYFEPFLGSGAILATVAPKNGLASDTFLPLIEIWKKLALDPEGLIDWYAQRRNLIDNSTKEEVYKAVLKSYNQEPNGADFLYLSRACFGGVVRFRKSDGYMSTPCGAHMPISVAAFRKRVAEWGRRLQHVQFEHLDYREAFAQAKKGDLIYCDPPYSHSQSILYGAQSFRLEELFTEIEKAKAKEIFVALSIDGNKKSGNFICDLPIPDDLFEQELFVHCGGSMLKRFQLDGLSQTGENVSDRLLLTY
jgi:DNA adenine methylase